MVKRISRLVATFGGIGFLPYAPGTWAAGVSAIIWYYASINIHGYQWQLIVLPLCILAGVYCSAKIITEWEKDPSHVVIDEVAGMCLTLAFIPPTLNNFLVGFILFRLFDILKTIRNKKNGKQTKWLGNYV